MVKRVVVGDLLVEPVSGIIPDIFYEMHQEYHSLPKPVVPRETIIQVCKEKSMWCTFAEIKTAIICACKHPVIGTVSTTPRWLFDVHAEDMAAVKMAVVGGIEGVVEQFAQNGQTTTEGVSNLPLALDIHPAAITNDIMEIRQVLGVEAANAALFNELKLVMDAASYINPRHIQLLVDTMTQTGDVVAASRHGMSRTKQPVLQRASFEETREVFCAAALKKSTDACSGVSCAIMLGRRIPGGTGAFDVVLQEQNSPPPLEYKWKPFEPYSDIDFTIDDDVFEVPDLSSVVAADTPPQSPVYCPDSPSYCPESPSYTPMTSC